MLARVLSQRLKGNAHTHIYTHTHSHTHTRTKHTHTRTKHTLATGCVSSDAQESVHACMQALAEDSDRDTRTYAALEAGAVATLFPGEYDVDDAQPQ